MLIYLDGFMDPALESGVFYYRCTQLERVTDPKEVLVQVDPPILVESKAIRRVKLQSRDEEFWRIEGTIQVGSEGFDTIAVFVTALDACDEFGIREGAVSSQLSELWKRGGYWNWFRDAIVSFARREGHTHPPLDHVEDGFKVGGYVSKLRAEHGNRMLPDEQVSFLESLPGWEW